MSTIYLIGVRRTDTVNDNITAFYPVGLAGKVAVDASLRVGTTMQEESIFGSGVAIGSYRVTVANALLDPPAKYIFGCLVLFDLIFATFHVEVAQNQC